MRKLPVFFVAVVIGLATTTAHAGLKQFVLDGNVGLGLLPGNENPASGGPGSGGLGANGIVFNTNTNSLSIDVVWGSGNGFTDLSGNATLMHIHGPTPSAAPGSFSENAVVLINLSGAMNTSASNGGLSTTVTIPVGNVGNLLAGQLYLNVHSAVHPAGEIRGTMVKAIPEPASLGLLGCGLMGVAVLVRRRRR